MLMSADFMQTALVMTVCEVEVLQIAFTGVIADRAVEGMIAEQVFEGHLLLFVDAACVGIDLQAFGDGDIAADVDTGTTLLDDLDFAHAAATGDLKGWMVAEVRDVLAGGAAGFEDIQPFREVMLNAVYFHSGHGVLLLGINVHGNCKHEDTKIVSWLP